MSRRILLVVALVVLVFPHHVQSADPAAGWRGVKVLPKENAVVKVGNETIDQLKIDIPWIVQDVKGEWLWVGNSRKGWVQRSQVVTMDEAPAYYTQLINSNRQKAWAYLNRGSAWQEKGELDLAIADYGEKLRLDPNAVTYNNRGIVWHKKKEYDKAIADFNQAIRLDPNHVTAFIGRGWAWNAKKEYDKAIADYTQAIRLDPNYAWGYNNLAWLQATCPDVRFRNGKRAVEVATKACELGNWTVSNDLETLAAAYAESGDFRSAVKYLKKAIDFDPNNAVIRGRLKLLQDGKPLRE